MMSVLFVIGMVFLFLLGLPTVWRWGRYNIKPWSLMAYSDEKSRK